MSKTRSFRALCAIIGFPLFFLFMIISFFLLRDVLSYELFTEGFTEHVISDLGIQNWLGFILVQILQVIVFIIPGEFTQISGGYLFGLWYGTLLSVIGILIGSILNFTIARFLGVSFVKAVLGEKKFQSFFKLMNSEKILATFSVLFFIPGFPKDSLCYLAGMGKLRALPFFSIATVARLPGIIGSSLIGAALLQRRWVLTIFLLILAGILLFVSLIFRKQIITWVHRLSAHDTG